MAAYASLLILARNIDPIHGDLNHVHHDLDLKPLSETVVQLQAIMENCPQETLSEEFEGRIRDFAYRANNIIESHFLQLMNRRDEGGCFSTVTCFLDSISSWMILRRPPQSRESHIPSLTDEAASLVVEAQNLQGAVVFNDPNIQFKESSSDYTPGRKVRLYSDISRLKEKLYGGSPQREVIPIVGMGGSGKTTLATVLFEDSSTGRRFDRRAWITVSQNYDKCTLLSQILRDLKESALENSGDSQDSDLGVKVSQTLKNRRYLIVIDDVWSEKLWDDIQIHLPDDGNGSRILLTTRLENVATYVVTFNNDCYESYIHRAELMDLEMSWSLLKETVFGQDEDCPVELEEIGKSIVKDCAGLPLAIVVIAGILSSANKSKDLWKKIAADVAGAIKKSSTESDGVAKILSLSYINLPHHLKPCFLYLACFPEDHEIKVSKLIMLWVAEGFLKPSKYERYEEEVAYEYLENLVKKNLVLVSKKEYHGKIELCRLHDLIRDMCVELAEKENFMNQINNDKELSSKEMYKDQIRFSICSEDSLSHVRHLPTAHVRSVLHFTSLYLNREVFAAMRFRLLRVLEATYVTLDEFPYQVCQLFLLRYLGIRMWRLNGKVPSSIKELQSLQVLTVVRQWIVELPVEIWEMPKLRHIVVDEGIRLPDPPIGTRSLSPSSLGNLQTLQSVVGLKFTEQVLHMIPNIKALKIQNFNNSNDCCLENLVRLSNLETLTISKSQWRNIQLPRSLKMLTLYHIRFYWSEIGRVAGSLPNLEVLKLKHNFGGGVVWEVKEGEFPKLKRLQIYDCDLVTWKYDGQSTNIFPVLDHLYLHYCMNLREIPWCIGDIDTLRIIEVEWSNELLMKWARKVKEEQEGYGNEYLQVLIIGDEGEDQETVGADDDDDVKDSYDM